VVEYGGRRLLIGVAPNQITLLDNQAQDAAATDTGPSEASDTMPTAGEPSSALSFAGQLKQFMQRD
jgi:flagellar biogenesis protein FliO